MLGRAHELLPAKPPRSRQAVRWHVGDTAVLSLLGELCVRKTCDKNGFLFETVAEPKRSIPLTFEEFDLLKDGYEFDFDPLGATPGKAAGVLKADEEMIGNLPDDERELVKNKLIAVIARRPAITFERVLRRPPRRYGRLWVISAVGREGRLLPGLPHQADHWSWLDFAFGLQAAILSRSLNQAMASDDASRRMAHEARRSCRSSVSPRGRPS